MPSAFALNPADLPNNALSRIHEPCTRAFARCIYTHSSAFCWQKAYALLNSCVGDCGAARHATAHVLVELSETRSNTPHASCCCAVLEALRLHVTHVARTRPHEIHVLSWIDTNLWMPVDQTVVSKSPVSCCSKRVYGQSQPGRTQTKPHKLHKQRACQRYPPCIHHRNS